MAGKPELIVFDLAGTTVDEHYGVHRVLQDVMADFDVSITLEDANAVMGISKPVAIEKLLFQYRYPCISLDLVQDIHDQFVKKMKDFYRMDTKVSEKEGVSATFQILKQANIKVAVDTTFERQITTPLLDRMGWFSKGLLDASVSSDEVRHSRPQPDLIFRAMELTGVSDPTCVVKVGDTAADIQEGKMAGCGWVIGITTGAFSREELDWESPTHLIQSIPEILLILGLN